jgi:DNA polymerase-1
MPRSTKGPALLVDGDITAHRASEANTTAAAADDQGDLWTYVTDVRAATQRFREDVEATAAELGCSGIYIAFSTHPNWRHAVLPSYKSNRKGAMKPPGYKALKAAVREISDYVVIEKPGLEGDDILGILATHESLVETKERIVWSDDKDLRGVPGTLFRGSAAFPVTITEDEADLFHLVQALSGDVTDGYKGCPGIGAVTATRMLETVEPRNRWGVVVAAYKKAGLTEDDALAQARVARILRATDYDFTKREPILWTP